MSHITHPTIPESPVSHVSSERGHSYHFCHLLSKILKKYKIIAAYLFPRYPKYVYIKRLDQDSRDSELYFSKIIKNNDEKATDHSFKE